MNIFLVILYAHIHRPYVIGYVWMYFMPLIIMLVAKRGSCTKCAVKRATKIIIVCRWRQTFFFFFRLCMKFQHVFVINAFHDTQPPLKFKNGRHCVLRFLTLTRQKKERNMNELQSKTFAQNIQSNVVSDCNLARRWRIACVTSRKSIPIGHMRWPNLSIFIQKHHVTHGYLGAVDNYKY